ncbi:MAG: F0F1 ATP synthase subunit alpha, partial [Bacilli bacterium]
MADSIDSISELIKRTIESHENKIDTSDVGTVVTVGDGICTVYGLDNAMYGEMVAFPHGVYGMVMNLNEDSVGCVILGRENSIFEGDQVKRTGAVVSVPVGDALLGRVVNAL